MKRRSLFAIPILLATLACAEEMPTEIQPQLAGVNASTAMAGVGTYHVTVYNMTAGQPFTPPLAATHRQSISLYDLGEPASVGVQQIAENGNLGPLMEAIGSSKHVLGHAVGAGPVFPGEAVELEISAERGAKYLSFVSMLICTNDGFTGVNSIRLPRDVGSSTTVELIGYDAGTEINTEDFVDIVPPCPALTGVDSDDEGTGMTNPELAEGGVIRVHPGIQGGTDLDPSVHGWTDPVGMVEIERIG